MWPIFFKLGNNLYALRTRPSSILKFGGLHLVELWPLINQNYCLLLFPCNNWNKCEPIIFKLSNNVICMKDAAKFDFEIWWSYGLLINQNCRLLLFPWITATKYEPVFFKLGNNVICIKDSAKIDFEIWRTSFGRVMAP